MTFLKTPFPLNSKIVKQSGSAYQKIQKQYFQKQFLKFIWPKPDNVYDCHNTKGIRLYEQGHVWA